MAALSVGNFVGAQKEGGHFMPKKTISHLTLDQRIEIQKCLDCGMAFTDIARRIGKHETSVSREVKKHLKIQKTSAVRKDKNGDIVIERRVCGYRLN